MTLGQAMPLVLSLSVIGYNGKYKERFSLRPQDQKLVYLVFSNIMWTST